VYTSLCIHICKHMLFLCVRRSLSKYMPVTIHTLTPVAGLFLTRLGFEKIFNTQKSALLVLWKGVINPPLQSLVN